MRPFRSLQALLALACTAPLAAQSGPTRAMYPLEVQRALGLQNLAPGRYRLRVTVSGGGLALTETGYLTVVEE